MSVNKVWMVVLLCCLQFQLPCAEAVRAGMGSQAAYVRLHIVNETGEPLYLLKVSSGREPAGILRYLKEHYIDSHSIFVPAGEKRIIECFGDMNITEQGDFVFELGNGGMQKFWLSVRRGVNNFKYVHDWRVKNVNFARWEERGLISDTKELTAVQHEDRELYAADDYLIALFRGRESNTDGLGFADLVLRVMPKEPQLADPEKYS